MWPGGRVASDATEPLRSTACEMWVAVAAPGTFGSLTLSPLHHSPVGVMVVQMLGVPFPFEGDRFPHQLGAVVQNTVLRGEQPAREVIHTHGVGLATPPGSCSGWSTRSLVRPVR